MKNYRYIKWMSIITISLLIITYELLRHKVLIHYLPKGLDIPLSSTLFIFGSGMFMYLLFNQIQTVEKQRYVKEREAKALFDQSTDGFFVFNHSGVLLDVNQGACQLSGWNQVEAIHRLKAVSIFVNLPSWDKLLNSQENHAKVEENVLIKKDGSKLPVSVTISVIPIDDENDSKIAFIVRDISQWKNTEKVIRDLYQETSQKHYEAHLLYNISRKISSVRDLTTDKKRVILNNVVKDINKLLRCEYCGLFLLDKSEKTYDLTAQSYFDEKALQAFNSFIRSNKQKDRIIGDATKHQEVTFIPLENEKIILGYLAIRAISGNSLDNSEILKNIKYTLTISLENVIMYHKLRDGAIVEERERLAREMHDGLSQSISCIHLKILHLEELSKGSSKAFSTEMESALKILKDISSEAYQEVRENLFDLRLTKRLDQRFIHILRKKCEKFQEQNNIKVDTHIKIRDEEHFQLPTIVKMHLVRMVQEALSNVQKHAQATNVRIEFECVTRNHCLLTIQDNGVGYDLQGTISTDQHYGISTMYERVKLINGDLIIDSSGEGTKLTIKIPLGSVINEENTGARM